MRIVNLPLRAAGAQEGRQPAVFHPLVNHPFSLGHGGNGREETAAKRSTAVGLLLRDFRKLFAVLGYRTATSNLGLRRRGIPVPRNTVACANRLHPQDLDNRHRLNCCAALSCRAQRRVAGMCSSTAVEMRICGYHAVEKILCRSPFPRLRSLPSAPKPSEEKVGVQRGRETMGVPSFLPPAVGTANASAAAAAKTPPGSGEPPARFECPESLCLRLVPPESRTAKAFAWVLEHLFY